MNKKTYFNKHLYREGLRGLKGVAIIMLALLSVFSIILSLSYTITDSSDYTDTLSYFQALTIQWSALYFLIIVFVVPIFTLKTFSFLTTRNGSDFYHSIPHKRQCLLITFGAAIATWTAICIGTPCIIAYAIYCFAAGQLLSLLSLVFALLHIFVAAMLVMSAICVACAVTGTLLTNIITTGLILFLPRLFIFAFRLLLSMLSNGIISTNSFLFGTKCNLVVQSFLDFENPYYYLYNFKPLLYTLVLCFIYLTLAAILFERRPSEIAMKPTLGKRLQSTLCILLGAAVSVFPIAFIVSSIVTGEEVSRPFIFYIVTMYVIIFVGMCMYELLTTKRIRNLIHIPPRALIVALINVCIIGGLYLGKNIVYSFTPQKDEIKSISFEFSPYNEESFFRSRMNGTLLLGYYSDTTIYDVTDSNDYLLNKFNTYRTNDETIREIVSKSLNDTLNDRRSLDGHELIRVKIHTGLRTVTRNINVSNSDYKKLKELVFADSDFSKLYTELPTIQSQNLSITDDFDYVNMRKEDLQELYSVVKEEISNLSQDPLASDLFSSRSGSYEWPRLYFSTKGINGYLGSSIKLNPNILPVSYEKYINLANKNSNTTISKHVQEALTDSKEYTYGLRINAINTSILYNVEYSLSFDINQKNSKQEKAIIDALSSSEGTAIDMNKKDTYLVAVALTRMSYDYVERQITIRYVQLDKETLDAFEKTQVTVQ